VLVFLVGFAVGVVLTVGIGLWVKHLSENDSRFLWFWFPRWMARIRITNAIIERDIREVLSKGSLREGAEAIAKRLKDRDS